MHCERVTLTFCAVKTLRMTPFIQQNNKALGAGVAIIAITGIHAAVSSDLSVAPSQLREQHIAEQYMERTNQMWSTAEYIPLSDRVFATAKSFACIIDL